MPSEGVARASPLTHTQCVLCVCMYVNPGRLPACMRVSMGVNERVGKGVRVNISAPGKGNVASCATHMCAHARTHTFLLIPASPQNVPQWAGLESFPNANWELPYMVKHTADREEDHAVKKEREKGKMRGKRKQPRDRTQAVADVLDGDARCVWKRISGLCSPLGERLCFPSNIPFVEKLWTLELHQTVC